MNKDKYGRILRVNVCIFLLAMVGIEHYAGEKRANALMNEVHSLTGQLTEVVKTLDETIYPERGVYTTGNIERIMQIRDKYADLGYIPQKLYGSTPLRYAYERVSYCDIYRAGFMGVKKSKPFVSIELAANKHMYWNFEQIGGEGMICH